MCIDVSRERFSTDSRVGAAGDVIHQRRVTGGSIGVAADVTAAVKEERISFQRPCFVSP